MGSEKLWVWIRLEWCERGDTGQRAAGWTSAGLAGSSEDLDFILVTMSPFTLSSSCARVPFIRFSKFLLSIFYAKKETHIVLSFESF